MKLIEMNWPQIQAIAPTTVAVLPIGSTEQHGTHLAISTDAAIVTAVAERAESELQSEVALCPTLAYGASDHHLAFAGTMSLSPETFSTVLAELVGSLLKSGFRRIVLLNGHGGNSVPASQALLILSQRYDDNLRPNIALASYWDLAGSTFCGEPPLESPLIRHACEYETAMMLFLHPDRVQLDKARSARQSAANNYIDWQGETPGRGVTMQKSFQHLTSTGAVGRPELATAAKGEHLIARATEATTQFLRDFAGWPLMEDLRNKTSE